MARRITWDDQKVAVARLALSQLSYATDTGAERGVIAEMLADLGDNLVYWCRDEACGECREEADRDPGRTVICDRRLGVNEFPHADLQQ